MENLNLSDVYERLRIVEKTCRDQKKELDEYVGYIERRLKKVFEFIEFHNIQLPLKYRNASGDKEPFKHKKLKPAYPSVFDHPQGVELEMAKDVKEYKKARERMTKLGEKGWPKRPELKPDSSEASLAVWVNGDSPQESKLDESSPSSQESPDHKNPPSQS